MPVDVPPAVFPAEGDQSLYERAARALSARSGRDEKVLQIASRAKAPGMGMENIVGESDGFTFWAECEQGTDRLARRKDTLPETLSGFIRNTTIEFRTISLPEAESVPRIGRLSRANFYRSHRQKRVGCHIWSIPKVYIEHSGAAYRALVQQHTYDLGYNIYLVTLDLRPATPAATAGSRLHKWPCSAASSSAYLSGSS
jgi:hypothetical protein